MDIWHDLEALGFFPDLAVASLKRVCSGKEPVAAISQLDVAFDQGRLFRHLTVVALNEHNLMQLHIDELDDGSAMVATGVTQLTRVRGISLVELVKDPAHAGGGSLLEVTVSIDIGSQRRTEVERMHCDDPECAADHGWSGITVPDDLTIRVSSAADGEEALRGARHFVDAFTSLMNEVTP